MAVATTWKGFRVAFGKADEGGVLNEDALKRTARKAVGSRPVALAQMDQALDEETFHAALGAVDTLVQGLRADLPGRSALAEGADELVDGCTPGGDGVEQGEEKILRVESRAELLHKAGFFGETIEFGSE